MAVMQVTALSKAGEPETRTVFYFSVGILLTGLIGVCLTGFTPLHSAHWQSTAWLIPIGVLASIGQWCMTRALSRGAALLVVNLQYVGIVFGSLYGLLLFGDRIELTSWAGIVLIVASGIAATVLRMRVLPDTSVEDH
jgi:S-adenosylmethionine uptake transporter